MRRRTILAAVAGGALATGGTLAATGAVDVDVPDDFGTVAGPPKTETPIETYTFGTEYRSRVVKKITCYESGAAELLFSESHSCYERIAFTHEALFVSDTDTGEALRIWQLPEFEGPIVIDLKGAIARKDDYPSRKFKFNLLAPDGEFCIGTGNEFELTVPEQYMPDA